MDIKTIFIFLLLLILIFIYLNIKNEQFSGNTGVYNYFSQKIMNPYQQQLTSFFSNDVQCSI
jgi:hypothetical protein